MESILTEESGQDFVQKSNISIQDADEIVLDEESGGGGGGGGAIENENGSPHDLLFLPSMAAHQIKMGNQERCSVEGKKRAQNGDKEGVADDEEPISMNGCVSDSSKEASQGDERTEEIIHISKEEEEEANADHQKDEICPPPDWNLIENETAKTDSKVDTAEDGNATSEHSLTEHNGCDLDKAQDSKEVAENNRDDIIIGTVNEEKPLELVPDMVIKNDPAETGQELRPSLFPVIVSEQVASKAIEAGLNKQKEIDSTQETQAMTYDQNFIEGEQGEQKVVPDDQSQYCEIKEKSVDTGEGDLISETKMEENETAGETIDLLDQGTKDGVPLEIPSTPQSISSHLVDMVVPNNQAEETGQQEELRPSLVPVIVSEQVASKAIEVGLNKQKEIDSTLAMTLDPHHSIGSLQEDDADQNQRLEGGGSEATPEKEDDEVKSMEKDIAKGCEKIVDQIEIDASEVRGVDEGEAGIEDLSMSSSLPDSNGGGVPFVGSDSHQEVAEKASSLDPKLIVPVIVSDEVVSKALRAGMDKEQQQQQQLLQIAKLELGSAVGDGTNGNPSGTMLMEDEISPVENQLLDKNEALKEADGDGETGPKTPPLRSNAAGHCGLTPDQIAPVLVSEASVIRALDAGLQKEIDDDDGCCTINREEEILVPDPQPQAGTKVADPKMDSCDDEATIVEDDIGAQDKVSIRAEVEEIRDTPKEEDGTDGGVGQREEEPSQSLVNETKEEIMTEGPRDHKDETEMSQEGFVENTKGTIETANELLENIQELVESGRKGDSLAIADDAIIKASASEQNSGGAESSERQSDRETSETLVIFVDDAKKMPENEDNSVVTTSAGGGTKSITITTATSSMVRKSERNDNDEGTAISPEVVTVISSSEAKFTSKVAIEEDPNDSPAVRAPPRTNSKKRSSKTGGGGEAAAVAKATTTGEAAKCTTKPSDNHRVPQNNQKQESSQSFLAYIFSPCLACLNK